MHRSSSQRPCLTALPYCSARFTMSKNESDAGCGEAPPLGTPAVAVSSATAVAVDNAQTEVTAGSGSVKSDAGFVYESLGAGPLPSPFASSGDSPFSFRCKVTSSAFSMGAESAGADEEATKTDTSSSTGVLDCLRTGSPLQRKQAICTARSQYRQNFRISEIVVHLHTQPMFNTLQNNSNSISEITRFQHTLQSKTQQKFFITQKFAILLP